jgi:DNA processing protein
VSRLAGHLEVARGHIELVLGLDDDELIEAVGGRQRQSIRAQLAEFDPACARDRCERAGVATVCRCEPGYPRRLLALRSPPAVLHVVGELDRRLALDDDDPVAIVGSRRASAYGLDVARALARSLAVAGITVVSGLALGVDSAAHAGALAGHGRTIAVLPGGADRPYPPAKHALYREIIKAGAAISELPPGTSARRWMFPARNRIIAALAAMTVVVEACERSGALLSARFARVLARPVGAVPGRITSPQAAGPNALLAAGATMIRNAQDVLDELFGIGVREAPRAVRPELSSEAARLLAAIAEGDDTPAALSRTGVTLQSALAALASLELAGYVQRQPGGRYSVVA